MSDSRITDDDLTAIVQQIIQETPDGSLDILGIKVSKIAIERGLLQPTSTGAGYGVGIVEQLAPDEFGRLTDIVWDMILAGTIRPGVRLPRGNDVGQFNLPNYHCKQ
jgi:hypothetical protein